MSLVDATRLCYGAEDTAATKRLLQRYGRKPLTVKDFLISGHYDRKSLRQIFLGPKAAGRTTSVSILLVMSWAARPDRGAEELPRREEFRHRAGITAERLGREYGVHPRAMNRTP